MARSGKVRGHKKQVRTWKCYVGEEYRVVLIDARSSAGARREAERMTGSPVKKVTHGRP